MTLKYKSLWCETILLLLSLTFPPSDSLAMMNWKSIYEHRGLSEEAATLIVAETRGGKTGFQLMEMGRRVDENIKVIMNNTTLNRREAGAVAAALERGGTPVNPTESRFVFDMWAADTLVKKGQVKVTQQDIQQMHDKISTTLGREQKMFDLEKSVNKYKEKELRKNADLAASNDSKLNQQELQAIIEALVEKGHVKVTGADITGVYEKFLHQ